MNERILELAEKAYIADSLEANPLWEKSEITESLLKDLANFHKKFAELLVRECIDVVAAGGEFASRPKLVEKLQEHFGVEE